jgi:tripartite-type tricarboxylate transporter receptor subunit TctC
MAATPSTPQDQLKILRTAFVKSVNDPELLAEAKKKTLEVDLITGEAAEALAKEVVSQPTDVIARMKRLLGE